eukprot:PhF_6_TR44267/c0_g1_i2/m.68185/K14288/XPOT; exportin-T
MEDYFLHAIQVAFINPNEHPETKREADRYLQNLQSTNEGWGLCNTLLTLPADGIHARLYHTFWAFQLIVNELPVVRPRMSIQDVHRVYEWMRTWVLNVCCRVNIPSFLRNKCAQGLVVYLEVADPSSQWGPFFQELFQMLDTGGSGGDGAIHSQVVELWLRVMLCIDERIVDPNSHRGPNDHSRATQLKDFMRDHVIERAVRMWYGILSSAWEVNPEVARLCLKVVEPYVSWIDILLVSTTEWVRMLYFFFTRQDLQVEAVGVMIELAAKKMPFPQKKNLFIQLCLIEALPDICPIAVEAAVRSRDDDGDAFSARVTDLVVNVGITLGEMVESGQVPEAGEMCTRMCDVVTPLFSTNFALSTAAYDFLLMYLNLVKKGMIPPVPETLDRLSKAIEIRCLLPPSPPDNEQGYQDYRRGLFNLLRVIFRINIDLCCHSVLSMMEEVGSMWPCSLQLAEGSLRILFEIGEGLRDVARDEKIRTLVHTCVRIPYLDHNECIVHLTYFDLLERFSACFCQGGPVIETILMNFLQHPNGVRHRVDNVRHKVCYVFSRMCATLRSQFAQYLPRIEDSLKPVLVDLNFTLEEKMFLFEGLGVLLWYDDKGFDRLRGVVESILASAVAAVQNPPSYADAVGLTSSHLSALAGLTKTIGNVEGDNQLVLHNLMQTVLRDVTPRLMDSAPVRDRLLALVQQYMNSVGIDAFPVLGHILAPLIQTTNTIELSKILRLFVQIVQKTKSASVPLVSSHLVLLLQAMSKFVTAECTDPTNVGFIEDVRGPLDILKQFFLLIHNLGVNDALGAISPQVGNDVFQMLLNGVVTHPEFELTRQCMQCFAKLIHANHPGLSQEGLLGQIAAAVTKQITAPYINPRDGKSHQMLLDAVSALHSLFTGPHTASRGEEMMRGMAELVGPQKAEALRNMLMRAADPGEARQGLNEIIFARR